MSETQDQQTNTNSGIFAVAASIETRNRITLGETPTTIVSKFRDSNIFINQGEWTRGDEAGAAHLVVPEGASGLYQMSVIVNYAGGNTTRSSIEVRSRVTREMASEDGESTDYPLVPDHILRGSSYQRFLSAMDAENVDRLTSQFTGLIQLEAGDRVNFEMIASQTVKKLKILDGSYIFLHQVSGATPSVPGEKGDKGDPGEPGRDLFQGEWSNTSSYEIGDVVLYRNILYVRTERDTGPVNANLFPSAVDEWLMLKGEKGDTGDTGAAGASGVDGVDGQDGAPGRNPYRGDWDEGTVYEIGDIVRRESKRFSRVGPHTTDPQWSPETNYMLGSSVQYNNNRYTAVYDISGSPTNLTPVDDSRWILGQGRPPSRGWELVDGADGSPGSPGADGVPGEPGQDGAQGERGPKGDPGPAGPAGGQGPAGPAGDQGATGPRGDTGPRGATGPRGETGPAGKDGTGSGAQVTDEVSYVHSSVFTVNRIYHSNLTPPSDTLLIVISPITSSSKRRASSMLIPYSSWKLLVNSGSDGSTVSNFSDGRYYFDPFDFSLLQSSDKSVEIATYSIGIGRSSNGFITCGMFCEIDGSIARNNPPATTVNMAGIKVSYIKV